MKSKAYLRHHFIVDFSFIAISIFVAIFFSRSGLLERILEASHGNWFLDSFFAGLFFTSAFTTAPAIAALAAIAEHSGSVLSTALFGALGALCGDIIIFWFVRDRVMEDVLFITQNRKSIKALRLLFHRKLFRFFTFFLGGIVIASPLPDELGLAMMGLTKTKTFYFIPVSYAANFLGILIIGGVASFF